MKKTIILLLTMATALVAGAQTGAKKAYVPVDSTEREAIAGAQQLARMLKSDTLWVMVDSEALADFIIEYQYFSRGKDHASLLLRDTRKHEVFQSRKVKANYRNAEESGRLSAKQLYEYCIADGVNSGDNYKWTVDHTNRFTVMMGGGWGFEYGFFENRPIAVFFAEGIAEYHINSHIAFGAGVALDGHILDPEAISSLSPQAEVIFSFPKKMRYTQYIRLRTGFQIPLSSFETNEDYDHGVYFGRFNKYTFSGLFGSFSFGRMWRNNLWLEGVLGLNSIFRNDAYDRVSAKLCVKFGYNLPVKLFK